MPDYREMYQRMLMVSEKAIDLLIKAQQECEELYINSPGPEIRSMQSITAMSALLLI